MTKKEKFIFAGVLLPLGVLVYVVSLACMYALYSRFDEGMNVVTFVGTLATIAVPFVAYRAIESANTRADRIHELTEKLAGIESRKFQPFKKGDLRFCVGKRVIVDGQVGVEHTFLYVHNLHPTIEVLPSTDSFVQLSPAYRRFKNDGHGQAGIPPMHIDRFEFLVGDCQQDLTTTLSFYELDDEGIVLSGHVLNESFKTGRWIVYNEQQEEWVLDRNS